MEQLNQGTEQILKELQSEVKEIRDALLGNKLQKSVGISDMVIEHEDRIMKLEEKLSLVRWFFLGAGIVGGVTVSKMLEIITKLIN
jgi:hypothetical protein